MDRLRRRLERLSCSTDSAYCHLDSMMGDLGQREQTRLRGMSGHIEQHQMAKGQGHSSSSSSGSGQAVWGGLTWRMREVLLDWFFDLERDLALHDETVFAAIHYLDLYLSRRTMRRRELQLLGVTCSMLASKTYEIIPQPMSEWLYLSHDQYARHQMVALERQLLDNIEWAVFQTTPCCYTLPWLQLLGLDKNTKDTKHTQTQSKLHGPSYRFVVDLAVRAAAMTMDYLHTPTSTVAAAAIALSFVYLRRHDDGHGNANGKGHVLGESTESTLNRPRAPSPPQPTSWRTASRADQAEPMAMLAAVSKLDLQGDAVAAMMAAMDQRICRLIADGDGDPAVCALYKLFTDRVAVEKRYGPQCTDLLALHIPKRRRPLKL